MLAEKFFLLLESLIRRETYLDGSVRVISISQHVPFKPGKNDLADAAIKPSQPLDPPVG